MSDFKTKLTRVSAGFAEGALVAVLATVALSIDGVEDSLQATPKVVSSTAADNLKSFIYRPKVAKNRLLTLCPFHEIRERFDLLGVIEQIALQLRQTLGLLQQQCEDEIRAEGVQGLEPHARMHYCQRRAGAQRGS